MAGSGKKLFIGCGVGCAAVVLLGILGVIGSVVVLTRPFDRAVGVQQELTELHGAREDYVPPAKGIRPQRLKAFIAVRKSILDHCEEFEDVQEAFLEMEELDQEGDPPPARVIIRGVGRVMGVAFGLVGKIGGLVEDRNEALLEQDMGLGEYTWIYVLAYNSYLGMRPNTGIDDEEGHCYAGSEWRTLQRLIENHIGALEDAGRDHLAELWRDELERLDRTDETVPFAGDELPPYLAFSFRQYHKKLEYTYCPAMAEFDLGRLQKKGLSFKVD